MLIKIHHSYLIQLSLIGLDRDLNLVHFMYMYIIIIICTIFVSHLKKSLKLKTLILLCVWLEKEERGGVCEEWGMGHVS